MCLMCILLLTGFSVRTEGTLSAPGDAIQAAAFSVCSPASLEGLCTHVVPHQTLPANIHVHFMIDLQRFWEINGAEVTKGLRKEQTKVAAVYMT